MLHRHFQVMKSIWGDSPNVEPFSFGIDSIFRGFCFTNKKWCCQCCLFHVNSTLHTPSQLLQIKLSPSLEHFLSSSLFPYPAVLKKSTHINCQPKRVITFVLSYKSIEKVISVSRYIPWPIKHSKGPKYSNQHCLKVFICILCL